MTDRAIKTPKAPANFFLILGLLYFLSAISGILTHIELFTKQEETPIPEIIWFLLLGLTNLNNELYGVIVMIYLFFSPFFLF